MLNDETMSELAERFGLTPGEIRFVESECARPVRVRVLQARVRACVRGGRCCNGLYTSLQRSRFPKEPLRNCNAVCWKTATGGGVGGGSGARHSLSGSREKPPTTAPQGKFVP